MKSTFATKVVVKEVVEKQSIVKADVTGASKITLTMNKAVDSELVGVTSTLTKGSAKKDHKIAAEGTTITLTTDTKLTAGTYNISIEGLETEALTASVIVEKNETLKTYVIGEELIPVSTTDTTHGYIYYKAVNQYDEMMTAPIPQATCSFAAGNCPVKGATASHEGKIYVNGINNALAILGQTGTVVLVDNNSGVNATGTVKYATAATADTCEVVGMYDTVSSSFKDIVAKDNADNYVLLMTIKDQYNHELSKSELNYGTDVKFTLAGGITNLTAGSVQDFTVDGKDYIGLYFGSNGMLRAGESILTVVNGRKGLLLTYNIKVDEYVTIASFTATTDGLYDKQENTLEFEAVDTEGNTITSYSVLKRTVQFMNDDRMAWRKNADSTATLVWNLKSGVGVPTVSDSHTDNTTISQTYSLNDNVSANYKVTTNTYTVYREREARAVQGLAAGTATQFATGRDKLEIGYKKLVFEDQYSNKVADGDDKYPTFTFARDTAVTKDGNPATGIVSYHVETSNGMSFTDDVYNEKFIFTASDPSASATVFLKYADDIDTKGAVLASPTDYDWKYTVTAVDTTEANPETLKIASINKGNYKKLSSHTDTTGGKLKVGDIEVTAKVAGVDTRIPDGQIEIVGYENNTFSTEEYNKKIDTKTAKVKVQVTVFDTYNVPTVKTLEGEYTVSYAAPFAYKVDGVVGGRIFPEDAHKLTANDVQKAYKYKDQYGDAYTVTGSAVDTHVTISMYAEDTDRVKVYNDSITNVSAIAEKTADYTFKITATAGNGKADKVRTFVVKLLESNEAISNTNTVKGSDFATMSVADAKAYVASVAADVVSYSALDAQGKSYVTDIVSACAVQTSTAITRGALVDVTSWASVQVANVYNKLVAQNASVEAVTKTSLGLATAGTPTKVITSGATSVSASAIISSTSGAVSLSTAANSVNTGDSIIVYAEYAQNISAGSSTITVKIGATYKVTVVNGAVPEYKVEKIKIEFVK